MPTYEVELSDGRIVDVEGDKEPTESDVMGLLSTKQSGPPSQPDTSFNPSQYVSGGGPMAGMAMIPSLAKSPGEPFVPIPKIKLDTQPPDSLGSSFVKGLEKGIVAPINVGSGFIEGMESPVGVAVGALGPIPDLAQSAIGAGFGIPAFKHGLQRVYEGTATGDSQEALEGGLETLTGGLITGGAAKGFVDNILPRTVKALKQSTQEIPDASKVSQTAKVHGDVRAQQEPTGQLPEQESVGGVQPQAQVGLPETQVGVAPEVPLKPSVEPQSPSSEVLQGATPPLEPVGGTGEAALTGLGGALKEGEIPETGAGGEKYGIAQRIREERAQAGQVQPIEPGEGISTPDSIERGRQIIQSDPAAPEKALSAFESDPQKNISADAVAAVRAQGEKLASEARKVEESFGTESTEYTAAKSALSDWDKRSKAMQTEWHKIGMAQRGETDIDTGSFTGIERAYRDFTGKDLPEKSVPAAKKIAEVNNKAQKAAAESVAKVNELFKEEPVEPHVQSLTQRITEALDKTASDALSRIKARRAEGRLFAGIDPVELADYAVYGASKIAKGAVEFSKWSAEMTADIGDYIKDHLKQIWDASNKKLDETVERTVPEKQRTNVKRTIRKQSALDAEKAALDAASRTVRENAIRIANLENKSRVAKTVAEKEVLETKKASEVKALKSAQEVAKKATLRVAKEEARVKEQAILDEQQKASDRSLEDANKIVRENAARVAEAENKNRSAIQAAEKKAAIAERKQAESNLLKSQKEAREAAIKAARAEQANQANPMRRVWNAVRGYLEKGETDQDTIRTKVATDLGLKPEQVYRLMARDERAKRMLDDMWLKQQTARRLKQSAKRWVMSLDEPKFKKFVESVPQAMFRAKVFGHAGVAFGTHAPAVGFMPKYWGDLARDYGKMWGMGFSKTFYERQIADLQNRKNFVKAIRFGLDNDPHRFEEYNPKGKTNMGGRSYTALKFIRQDIFDKVWDNLPKSQQNEEVGWAIANRINHMTGTLSTKGPPKALQGRMKADIKPPSGASKALFAPTLLFSRYRFIFGDTIQDLGILSHWSTASPGEKAAVKFDVNSKLWVFGTGLALLAANAGLLAASGSKQKINFTDPTKSDWLKFKAFGMTFSPGNAMLSMARIIPREIETIAGGKKARADEDAANKAWEFARGQMSPFLGTATDLFFGTDYSGRPLPRKLFGAMEQKAKVPLRQREQGVKPYTWPEYAFQQASPIPLQEGLKEVWHNGWGMSDKQIEGILKALEISGIMGVTGGRVAEDWEAKEKPEMIYK